MIRQALDWLAPTADERVLDLFCGLGNFSLPLARRVARVVGVEGVAAMVERAGANALANGLATRTFSRPTCPKRLPKRPGRSKVLPLCCSIRRATARSRRYAK